MSSTYPVATRMGSLNVSGLSHSTKSTNGRPGSDRRKLTMVANKNQALYAFERAQRSGQHLLGKHGSFVYDDEADVFAL